LGGASTDSAIEDQIISLLIREVTVAATTECTESLIYRNLAAQLESIMCEEPENSIAVSPPRKTSVFVLDISYELLPGSGS
jgi:hypothetical protein